ncbi:MAG: hypothetical protein ABIG71_03585 [Candidatus Uhrbacteria bacterium]
MDVRRVEPSIVALRSAYAAGAQDIRSVHQPLFDLLVASGAIEDAIPVALDAVATAQRAGALLLAMTFLRYALERCPGEQRLLAARDALDRVCAGAAWHGTPKTAAAPTCDQTLIARINALHYSRLQHCAVRVRDDRGVRAVLVHPDGAVPSSWIEQTSIDIVFDTSEGERIVVATAEVWRAEQDTHTIVFDLDADTLAYVRTLLRSDTTATITNIAALVMRSDDGVAHRIPNIYYSHLLATAADA